MGRVTSTGDRMGAARLRATHARTSAPRTQGWDKTYCLQFVKPDFDEIHFFGDKTFQGGNDYEICVSADTLGHTVTGPGVCVGGGGAACAGETRCARARARANFHWPRPARRRRHYPPAARAGPGVSERASTAAKPHPHTPPLRGVITQRPAVTLHPLAVALLASITGRPVL